MLLTIADLQNLQPSHHKSPSQSSAFRSLQERLQLSIRQQQMGLLIQPLLKSDPALKSLVEQVQRSIPNALQSGKQLKLHHPISAHLIDQVYIQVEINIGFYEGSPKLFDWAIRELELSWYDQIKLWAATQHYEADPNQVKLIVLALHPNRNIRKVMHCWNEEQHGMTTQALLTQLNAQSSSELTVPCNQLSIDATDIDSIREVVL